MNIFRIFLFAALLAVGSSRPDPAFAETDLYPFPDTEDLKVKSAKEKPTEPFVQVLAKKFGIEEKVLTKSVEKGFGRTELIRLILISKKSDSKLADLLKERENGTRLAKIAQARHLDNHKIRKEAFAILKELEAEEKKVQADLKRSSSTVAGVSEAVTKDGKGPESQKAPDSGKH